VNGQPGKRKAKNESKDANKISTLGGEAQMIYKKGDILVAEAAAQSATSHVREPDPE
jgi:hypothetical protein